MADVFYYLTMILLVTVSIMLMLLILIQKGRGGGLASAFGGVGGHTAFGSKTGDVLTWATAIVFGVFLLLAILANVSFNAVNRAMSKPAPITTVANPTPTDSAPVTADPAVANPPPAAPIKNAPSAPAEENLTGPATKP